MTVSAEMQQRRGTAAAWTAANPVLLDGEIGVEKDTGNIKIGDGTTAWNSLQYGIQHGAYEALAMGAPDTANTIVLIGDSRIAREYNATASAAQTQEQGAFAWGQLNLSHRLKCVNYAGVSGNMTADVLARWATAVTAYTAGWVLIGVGVNDATNGVTAAAIIANLQQMISLAKVEGKRVVLLTIAPNNAHTTAQRQVVNDVNKWIKWQENDGWVVPIDVAAPIIDYTNGNWLASYSTDGLHQDRMGAARQGKVIASVLGPLVRYRDPLPVTSSDSPTTSADANWLANPFMAGTGGTLASGATGSVPTSWTLTNAAVGSLVARTDQLPGQWFQMDTTAATADAFLTQEPAIPALIVPGTDRAYAVAEIQSDAWTAATDFQVYVQFRNSSQVVLMAATCLAHNESGTAFPLENQPGVSQTVVFRTPDVLVPATTAFAKFFVEFNGQGQVRVGRTAIYKV